MKKIEHYEKLKNIARSSPTLSGVYLWRDDENRVIYVGKAKNLRNRLNSYFSGKPCQKTFALLSNAENIETIITPNEYEALLLENILIKQYFPKYNVSLKDDKTYPMIRISAEEFPRVFKTRRLIEDKSKYFGPFPNVKQADIFLEVINKLFQLRKCQILRKKSNPCMYYHIKQCKAPCCNRISKEDYEKEIAQIQKLLSGETESFIIDMTMFMHEEAKSLRFERAVQIRDAIKAIEEMPLASSIVDFDPEGRDYIAWASEGILTTFTVFSMRGGKLIGRELFRTSSAAEVHESLETFIAMYYNEDCLPPPQIYLLAIGDSVFQNIDTDFTNLKKWFKEKFNYEVALLFPAEKRHSAVLAMAHNNALEDIRRGLKERGAGPGLDELKRVLNLTIRPERIEGFDIAQLDGKYSVASLVSFKNGLPDKKNYRYFKLRTVIGIVDDFAAMREVVRRRYSRIIKEGKELPDLILIDGGIGQVNSAKAVLEDLGLDVSVIGLAKRDEEIWFPYASAPLCLSKRSEGLKILQFIRDECHRFATSFNQKLRSKELSFSVLESIEGIGAKRAEILMKIFGDLRYIAKADVVDIMKKCALNEELARKVKAYARLALEDQKAAQGRLQGESSGEKLADIVSVVNTN